MKKIIMFDFNPNEKAVVRDCNQKFNVEIKPVSNSLNMKTLSQVKGFDGIITHSVSKRPEFYQKLAALGIKQIALRHTGYEIVNLKAARANHLVVTNVPAYSPRSVAEMVLTHVMFLLRHIGIIAHRERRGNFLWAPDIMSREIHDLTVGVIGTGKIGSTVARVFKALGCNVLANDLQPSNSLEATVKYVSKRELLKKSDVVTLHTQLTPLTTHMIGAKQFQMMKDSVIFINASRGAVVDTPALIKALDKHEISAAGLDTVENELPVFNHDSHGQPVPNAYIRNLIKRPNVIMTPHVAYYTNNSIRNMVKIALLNTLAVLDGKRPADQVD